MTSRLRLLNRGNLAALVAVGLASVMCGACAGDPPMRPQTPTDVTSTTGATVLDLPPSVPSASSSSGPRSSLGDPLDGSDPRRIGPIVNDQQLVAVIEAACSNAGRQAIELLRDQASSDIRNPQVTALAQRILGDEEGSSAELKAIETRAVLIPQDSATTDHVNDAGAETLATLRAANPTNLDRAYVDAQVTQQRALIELLDRALTPRTANPQLAEYLQKLRGVVAANLQTTEGVQSSIR